MRFVQIFTLLTALLYPLAATPCTNFLVTPGASTDASTMVTYAADAHVLYGELYFLPAAHHPDGAMLDVYEWDSGRFLGTIPQARQTFSVVGNINEHQVTVAETTFGGREELRSNLGVLDYGSLMWIALQRATTAREAITVITSLVAEHGYVSKGEVFSIADPNEAWLLEMIGKGPEHKGAVWVARRIPDGFVSAHANCARIGTFPLNDPKNTLYSPDVISFAREKGYFDGPDSEFHFANAYAPLTWRDARVCEARVWSFFRAVAPKDTPDIDFIHGTRAQVQSLPLWIKPERKLNPQDLMDAMRDHFEGTPLDLSTGVGAGPFALPYRWRPLEWELDGVTYLNDRSTATQQTAFSFVAQMRASLPGPIGGVLWFSVDDAASTVYVPMYAGILEIPHPFRVGVGDFTTFTWDSAFWTFNTVANYAYGRYSDMIKDIRKVQRELEGSFLAEQASIDQAALLLYKQSPRLAREYLTDYATTRANLTLERWNKLFTELVVKYLDGNIRNEKGEVTHPPYPDTWLRRIVDEDPERYRIRDFPDPLP